MTISWHQLLLVVIVFISIASEALAEICSDGTRCTMDLRCCSDGTGCCHDDSYLEDKRYNYGYRLSIWNMWYFWFVILFLMMSCFGGCGYYKHRQRFGGQPVRDHRSFFSYLAEPYNNRNTSRVLTLENGGYPDRSIGTMGYVISRTPDVSPAASMAPPPYTEVMNNPGLFPPNTKIGVPVGTSPAYSSVPPAANFATQMPQPPPYTEVANQTSADTLPANQNTVQAANQGTDTSATIQ